MRTRNIVLIIVLLVIAVVGARFWFNAKAPLNPAPAMPAVAKTIRNRAMKLASVMSITKRVREHIPRKQMYVNRHCLRSEMESSGPYCEMGLAIFRGSARTTA